jgi:2-polyprenyl-3-methyl-5-hydroxy-6-metoxy-1,4-benzoquinol methylase
VTEYSPHPVEWTPEKVSRVWDFYASSPAHRAQFFSAHSGAAIVDRAGREVGLRGKRILDFGCGRGDLLGWLFDRGIAAGGIDFAADAVAETQQRFGGQPLFDGVQHADSLPTSAAAGAYDVVFLVEVLEHLLDDQVEGTLHEVARVLSPGGRVIVTTPNAEDLSREHTRCPDCGATFHRWQHQRSFTPASIAELFAASGFETVSAQGVYWGATTSTRLRTRLRHPRQPFPQPHLLYVGLVR